MARTHGRLFCTIWDDDDYVALSPAAKNVFSFLLSQKDLTHAGTIFMRTPLWAELIGYTLEETEAAVEELNATRFVVVDRRCFELLVRTLVRGDGVYKQPNVYKSAIESMRLVSSRLIRAALAEELARLDESGMNAEIRKAHADIIDWLRRNSDGPNPKGSAKGSGNPVCPDSDFGSKLSGGNPGVSEIRQKSMITDEPVDNLVTAGQVLPFEGTAKGSDKGSLARASSPFPFPLTHEEPSLSATATPPANTTSNAKAKRPKKPKADPDPRPDVEALCNRLVELMVARGCRTKPVTDAWRTEARLLLDKDGIHPQFAMDVLEWSQKSSFWKTNILSIPKFREKWDTLYQQAERECGPHPNNAKSATQAGTDVASYVGNNVVQLPRPRLSTTDQRVAQAKAAGREFAALWRAQQAQGAI